MPASPFQPELPSSVPGPSQNPAEGELNKGWLIAFYAMQAGLMVGAICFGERKPPNLPIYALLGWQAGLLMSCWAGAWVWLFSQHRGTKKWLLGISPLLFFSIPFVVLFLHVEAAAMIMFAVMFGWSTLGLAIGWILQIPLGIYARRHNWSFGVPDSFGQIAEPRRLQFRIQHIIILTTIVAAFMGLIRIEPESLRHSLHFLWLIVNWSCVVSITIMAVFTSQKLSWRYLGFAVCVTMLWLAVEVATIAFLLKLPSEDQTIQIAIKVILAFWNILSLVVIRLAGLRMLQNLPTLGRQRRMLLSRLASW